MRKKKNDSIIFENIEVLDAGAKGVSVAKAPDGKVIFIPNVVPGDCIDVKTFKPTVLVDRICSDETDRKSTRLNSSHQI